MQCGKILGGDVKKYININLSNQIKKIVTLIIIYRKVKELSACDVYCKYFVFCHTLIFDIYRGHECEPREAGVSHTIKLRVCVCAYVRARVCE